MKARVGNELVDVGDSKRGERVDGNCSSIMASPINISKNFRSKTPEKKNTLWPFSFASQNFR